MNGIFGGEMIISKADSFAIDTNTWNTILVNLVASNTEILASKNCCPWGVFGSAKLQKDDWQSTQMCEYCTYIDDFLKKDSVHPFQKLYINKENFLNRL